MLALQRKALRSAVFVQHGYSCKVFTGHETVHDLAQDMSFRGHEDLWASRVKELRDDDTASH
jgi:hypothetical protein